MARTHIESVLDGIENYDIGTSISRNSTIKINVATCKRGRLKGRKVALKTISRNLDPKDFDENAYQDTSQLHRHLHHPDILSVLSTFESSSAFYEVLEYAQYGTLSEWITSRNNNGEPDGSLSMPETQLRGVLQPLIKALLHIHQNKVLHLNVNPSTIFITSDHRVKLGGFKYCRNYDTKLSPFLLKKTGFVFGQDAPVHHQKSAFSAPEVLMQEQLGPAVDVWSLGQLCVLLSNGSLQDGLWNQSIPQTASYELRDLIEGLTQPDAADRLPLRRVLSHPFFNPILPTDTLSTFISSRSRASPISTIYETSIQRTILGPFNAAQRRPSIASSPMMKLSKNKNADPTDVPLNEHQPKIVVLEPIRRRSSAAPWREVPNQRIQVSNSNPTNRIDRPSKESDKKASPLVPFESKRPALPITVQRSIVSSRISLNAGALPPQVFRTPHGMIMIQPSKAIIVDLREGERMKGRDGGVVLVVQPDGNKVDVYSAPRLSVPCVLQKPISTWEVGKLPSQLGKPYEYAVKYLQAVKKKTPMVTLNLSTSKFVMMSNTPLPDIEMTVPCPNFGRERSPGKVEPTIRLRYSRQENTLEISKFTNSDTAELVSGIVVHSYRKAHRGGLSEWSKRVIPLANGIDMAEIREDERKAVNCLQSSRHLWEHLEKTATDMDSRITNNLSDEYLIIRSRSHSSEESEKPRDSRPPRKSPKENISYYPSPTSSAELEAEEPPQVAMDELRRQNSIPILSKTKPRLLGLGLPPRPRRVSISNSRANLVTPVGSTAIPVRQPV